MAKAPSGTWVKTTRKRLKKILTQNIMPFWYPATIDEKKGGYYLNHDVDGKPKGDGPKMIVSQARMVWYFAKLKEAGWAGKEALRAAEHGFRFLKDRMWDHKCGGFFWEMDPQGNFPMPFKHMYGQTFALYGISEYAIASGSSEALDFAREIFGLMEKHGYDAEYGGYREIFSPDWSLPKVDMKTDVTPGMDFKTMNTHLHLLEAFTVLYQATKDPLVMRRLGELILILCNSVVRMNVGACTDLHKRDWTPVHGPMADRISFGHNIEAIWLIEEACKVAYVPIGPLTEYFRTVYDYCIKYGLDAERGGLYDSGPFNKPADRLGKIWWVQAEALVAMARMYNLLRDPVYLEHFDNVLDWTEKHQVDWKHGDWFDTVMPDGRIVGDKAYPWKAAYHTGRAMMEIISVLDHL